MIRGKVWRLGILALVTVVLIAVALTPIPGADIVVQMPGRGQVPDWPGIFGALGLVVVSLAALLGPPAVLIWLAIHVLRHGLFFGKQTSQDGSRPH